MTKAPLTFPSIDATAFDAQSSAATLPELDDSPRWSRLGGLLAPDAESEDDDDELQTLKTHCSTQVAQRFRRLCRENGMSVSKGLLVLVIARLDGADSVASMAASQISAMAGFGPKGGR